MTSPSSDVAKIKLGQYLHEAEKLRQQNQLKDALIIIIVCAEFFWRKHQHTRSAGLLLEACDLFYLLNKPETSQHCLVAALDLAKRKPSLVWWELELLGTVFLLAAGLALIENPLNMSKRLQSLRQMLPEKLSKQIRREDGYRIAITLRRAQRLHSLSPIDALDSKTTVRSRSEFTTLYEYLMGMAERYMLIRDALMALRRDTQQED